LHLIFIGKRKPLKNVTSEVIDKFNKIPYQDKSETAGPHPLHLT